MEQACTLIAQPWTFRRCLLWCLPALIVGGFLRISFLMAIPEAYYGSDSSSYFSATIKLYTKGKIDIDDKRRWLYPILLIATPLMPGNVPQAVAVVQHVLGLLTIVGIGWIASNLGQFRGLTALGASMLAAVWPRMLWYEHEIVAESWMLAAFVSALCLALPLDDLKRGRRLLWFLVAAGSIVAFKPHGRPLWLGLVTLVGLWHFRRLRWPHYLVLACTVMCLITSGNDRQGSWLFLSSTLPLVQSGGEKWPEYRVALRPAVDQVREKLENYPFIQQRYKKALKRSYSTPEFGPVWAKLNQDEKQFATVAKGLALEGIRHEPINFLRLVTYRIGYVLGDPSSADDFPVQHFWDQQQRRTEEHRRENPRQIPFVYEATDPEIDAMISNRRANKIWFEPWLTTAGRTATWLQWNFVKGQVPPNLALKWTGLLVVAGMGALLIRRRWQESAMLILPAAFYIFVIFSVGDRIPRYLQPVDWVGLVLAVMAMDGLAAGIFVGLRLLNSKAGSQ